MAQDKFDFELHILKDGHEDTCKFSVKGDDQMVDSLLDAIVTGFEAQGASVCGSVIQLKVKATPSTK